MPQPFKMSQRIKTFGDENPEKMPWKAGLRYLQNALYQRKET